jgi:hypothetical protein
MSQRIGFGGQVAIDDNRRFFLTEAVSFPSLGELKAGAEPGIDADTLVGLLVTTFPDEDATTDAISLRMNGTELL